MTEPLNLPDTAAEEQDRRARPDYAVGYGKPPEHTRFQKGRSGNPRGRPRGSKNLSTLVTEALDKKVNITEEGRRRKVSKREIIVTQLVNKSAHADLKATQILFGIMQDIERRAEASAAPAVLTDADRQVLHLIHNRRLGDRQGDTTHG